jgi:hypothetical protein
MKKLDKNTHPHNFKLSTVAIINFNKNRQNIPRVYFKLIIKKIFLFINYKTPSL